MTGHTKRFKHATCGHIDRKAFETTECAQMPANTAFLEVFATKQWAFGRWRDDGAALRWVGEFVCWSTVPVLLKHKHTLHTLTILVKFSMDVSRDELILND